jgi:hypothetical protein
VHVSESPPSSPRPAPSGDVIVGDSQEERARALQASFAAASLSQPAAAAAPPSQPDAGSSAAAAGSSDDPPGAAAAPSAVEAAPPDAPSCCVCGAPEDVCDDDKCEEKNPILRCTSAECAMTVHFDCYFGVDGVAPPGPFWCDTSDFTFIGYMVVYRECSSVNVTKWRCEPYFDAGSGLQTSE